MDPLGWRNGADNLGGKGSWSLPNIEEEQIQHRKYIWNLKHFHSGALRIEACKKYLSFEEAALGHGLKYLKWLKEGAQPFSQGLGKEWDIFPFNHLGYSRTVMLWCLSSVS